MTVFEYETAEQLNELASFLTDIGLHLEAVECLTKGLFLDPDNGYLWFNLALVYRKQNRRTDSIHALQMAMSLVSDDADIWDTIGVSLFELGEFEGSAIAFKNAFKHEKKSSRIWNNYGTLLFNQEKYEDAKNAFLTAMILDPKNEEAFLNLYDTYEQLGDKTKIALCKQIFSNLGF